jgi:hypothetical protein
VPGILIAAPRVAEADHQFQQFIGRAFDIRCPIMQTGRRGRFATDPIRRLPNRRFSLPEY